MNNYIEKSEKSRVTKMVQELKNPKVFASAQNDPVRFFAEHGVDLPANTQYEIHLDDDKISNFVIPFDPSIALAEDQLNLVIAAQKKY